MKRIFILTALLASPAFAFDPDEAYYRGMSELHQQEMARAERQYQDEAPQRAFNAIEARGNIDAMEQDAESNRNEIFLIERGY